MFILSRKEPDVNTQLEKYRFWIERETRMFLRKRLKGLQKKMGESDSDIGPQDDAGVRGIEIANEIGPVKADYLKAVKQIVYEKDFLGRPFEGATRNKLAEIMYVPRGELETKVTKYVSGVRYFLRVLEENKDYNHEDALNHLFEKEVSGGEEGEIRERVLAKRAKA